MLVFLIGFLFSFFLLQNLPFTFGDDLNVINTAKQTPWRELFLAVLNPFTPAWYVHGAESLLTTRAFQTFLFKGLYKAFGYEVNVFWALKALGYAGVGSLVFAFLFLLTRNRWLGFAGSLFFFLLPPVYRSLSWIADSELLGQMLAGTALFLFYRAYTSDRKDLLFSFRTVLGIIVLAGLGIKLKETARLVPFALLGFLLLHQNRNFFKWGSANAKNGLLLASTLFLLSSVIPWKKAESLELDARSHTAIFNFDLSNLLLALGPLTNYLALAFLGFFLMVGISLAPRLSKKVSALSKPPSGALTFLLVWAGLGGGSLLLGFRLEGNIRYLTTVLIPLTILVFFLINKPLEILKSANPSLAKILIVPLLSFIVFFQTPLLGRPMSFEFKLDEIIFMRNFYGGTDIADYLLTQKVYEDRFGDKDVPWQELDDFYRGLPPSRPLEFHEIRIKHWDRNADTSLPRLKELGRTWGAVYVFAFEEGLYARHPEVRLIWRGKTDNRSLYSALIGRVKKKAYRRIYLYQLSSEGVSKTVRTASMTS